VDDAIGRERRASSRVAALSMAGMERARVRPGRTASVVDLSAGGALIETDWRLLPGMRVEILLGDPASLFCVAGRVLRCHVALLDHERIRYRCALMFEERLSFGEAPTHGVVPGT
jgi:hypothetical protein